MDYLKDIATIIAILGGAAGITITLHTHLSNKLSNSIKVYDIYKEVKILLDNSYSNENLASMRAALSCIISRELTIDEINWFIKTPSAFAHIKDYSTQARYINISRERSGFSFKEQFSSRESIIFEASKNSIQYIALGTLSCAIYLMDYETILALPFQILLYGFAIVFGILSLKNLRLVLSLVDAHRMTKYVVSKSSFQNELKNIQPPENTIS